MAKAVRWLCMHGAVLQTSETGYKLVLNCNNKSLEPVHGFNTYSYSADYNGQYINAHKTSLFQSNWGGLFWGDLFITAEEFHQVLCILGVNFKFLGHNGSRPLLLLLLSLVQYLNRLGRGEVASWALIDNEDIVWVCRPILGEIGRFLTSFGSKRVFLLQEKYEKNLSNNDYNSVGGMLGLYYFITKQKKTTRILLYSNEVHEVGMSRLVLHHYWIKENHKNSVFHNTLTEVIVPHWEQSKW